MPTPQPLTAPLIKIALIRALETFRFNPRVRGKVVRQTCIKLAQIRKEHYGR